MVKLCDSFNLKLHNTKYKIINSSAMYVKIAQLDGIRIRCTNLSLPENLFNSKSVKTFNNINNNFFFL